MENTASNISSFPAADAKGDDSLTRSARASIDQAATQAHSAVNKAAEQAKPAIDRAAQYAHQAVDKAADVAGPTVDWVGDKAESLRVTQKKVLDDTCNYVSANPWKAVGIAAVLGLLLGRIAR